MVLQLCGRVCRRLSLKTLFLSEWGFLFYRYDVFASSVRRLSLKTLSKFDRVFYCLKLFCIYKFIDKGAKI